MSFVPVLRGVAVCVVFDVLGELASRELHVPLPGPVVGMLLLFAAFVASPRLAEASRAGASLLLRHMSLLFVPAAVSALTALSLLALEGPRILLVLVVSTTLALVGGAWAFALAAPPREDP